MLSSGEAFSGKRSLFLPFRAHQTLMVWSPHAITFRPGEETDITTVGDRLNATRQAGVVAVIRDGIARNARALQDIGFLDVPELDEGTQVMAAKREEIQQKLQRKQKKLQHERRWKPGEQRRLRKTIQQQRARVGAMHARTERVYSAKTEEDVAANAEAVLHEYEAAVSEGIEWRIEQTRRQLSKWSIAAEAFEPNLLLDWTIDRQEEQLEAGLGIKSLAHVEVALAEKYRDPENTAPCHHLHLGAGDYSVVHELQSDAEPYSEADTVFVETEHGRKRSELWQEVGVSDRLYISIEKILWKFVRPEMQRSPAVKEIVAKLALGCQTALTQKWYDSSGPHGELKRKKGIVFRDLNDIFGLLATPEYLLHFVHFYEEGDPFLSSCTPASPEFEHEHLSTQKDNRPMSMDAHAWLIAYQGKFTVDTFQEYRGARSRAPVKCAESLGWLQREAEECYQHAVNLPAFQDETLEGDESNAGRAQQQLWELCRKLEEHLGIELDALPPSRLDVPFVVHLVHQRLRRMYTLMTGEEYAPSRSEEQALAVIHSYDAVISGQAVPVDRAFFDAVEVLFAEFNDRVDTYVRQQLPTIPNPPLPADLLQSDQYALLEQIFTPELTRGVRGFRQYRNADYRKGTAFGANRFEHVEPEGGTGASLTMENVPQSAVVLLRPDRDPEGEKEYLAVGERKNFCGHSVSRSQDAVSVGHYMFPRGFSIEVVSLPDLNEHAVFHDGHIPGQFSELDALVPDQSFLLATASRSQSHEGERGFVGTVETAITKLEPGGCLITDGCIESYTRIMRFIASQDEHFRVDVLFDRETHRPKSMLIQRAHQKGYFMEEEKRRILSPGVYVRPVEQVYKRRDLYLKDRTRRKLLAKYENKYAFADIHPTIDSVMREELVFAVYGALLRRDSFYSGQQRRAQEVFDRALQAIRRPLRQFAAATPHGTVSPSRLFKASVGAAPVTNLLDHLYPGESVSPPQLPAGELDLQAVAKERDNDPLVRLCEYWARNLDCRLPLCGRPEAQVGEFNLTERELEQTSEALYERVQLELAQSAELRCSTFNFMLLYMERMQRLMPGMSREQIMQRFFAGKIKMATRTWKRIFSDGGEQPGQE